MTLSTKIEKMVRDHKVEIIDVRFSDPLGVWQHASVPVAELEGVLKNGIGFDGSSIKGFQHIYDSDLILTLDESTAHVDPFMEVSTLTFIANVQEPESGKRYSRDPRFIAEKAEDYLKKSGLADVSYWGPEAEFFVFSHLSYSTDPQNMGFVIDSPEAAWRRGAPSSQRWPCCRKGSP